MSKSADQSVRTSSVVFYAYPKLIYVWPLIVMGFAFYPFMGIEWFIEKAEYIGWVYLLVSLLVILTVAVDVERNYAVFWLVSFIAGYFLVLWLRDVQGFKFFGVIYYFFAELDVTYDRGFGMVMSILLSVPFAVMIIWSRLNDKWRITHNEFEHYAWGRADDSLARGAKRVRSTYPDLLELLLCGAGTLIVYSATGRSELRRIHNIPLLFLVRKKIDRILESTSVTIGRAEDARAAEIDEETEAEESAALNQGVSEEGDAGNDLGREKL